MAPRSARAPGEVRGWGSAGYSAPPLASSISLPSAGSRPTPGKGPDAGQRFTVPPDSAVRRRPRPATARPEERGGKAQAAHYPRAARGAEERALCPSPVRSPPSHMQMRRINEQREGETELRPGGGVRGGRRACSTHIPTCAGIRVHPVAERAVTSLHKPWLAPGPRGRERAGGRRSPYLPFRESGALDPSTHMTGTRLPPVWGWAVCECLFWMRRRRVQLPSLSTVHRPCS